ncbi:MAG: DUF7673 family protein [Psychrobacter alimentarius]
MNPLLAELAERAGLQTEEEYAREQATKRQQHKEALTKVLQMALDDCGGSRVCRDFLLSLYNGRAYPFDMNGLRNLDSGLYAACITIMNIDCRPNPPFEIHNWFTNGDEVFARLKASRAQDKRR